LYLAKTDTKGTSTYYIRESYLADGYLQSRGLIELGADPGKFIRYPGGNAYYFDEKLIEALEKQGVADAGNRLDDLLWEFLKPEIRNALDHFCRPRGSRRKTVSKSLPAVYHLFDKRRVLFLKSGSIDQGPIGRLPRKLFKVLENKSRDEIEQHFLSAEHILKPDELKIYTYVIFDLQKHFTSPLARKFPSAMNSMEMDTHFIEAVCRLNEDSNFWRGLPPGKGLNEYIVRFVVMYFDNPFPGENFMAAYVRDFMRSRRGFRFPDRVGHAMSIKEAGGALGLSPEQVKKMTRRDLTRHYRKMAIKLHPDQGGDHAKFIKITEAYQVALKKIGKK
jgi:hypothetical protein